MVGYSYGGRGMNRDVGSGWLACGAKPSWLVK